MSTAIDAIVNGSERRFDYLFAGSNLLADYNNRNGQIVTVVRPLIAGGVEYDNEGDAMYLVRFPDGFEGHVYDFELVNA
jgi:hypothetical protein